MIEDWSAYPNFSKSEMACRGVNCCGGRADMDPAFMTRLQVLRNAFGGPLRVTSGYRCEVHNARVGGSARHPSGMAADIAVTGSDAHRLLKLALALGFTGVGIKQHGPMTGRFLHVDTFQSPHEPLIWTY